MLIKHLFGYVEKRSIYIDIKTSSPIRICYINIPSPTMRSKCFPRLS